MSEVSQPALRRKAKVAGAQFENKRMQSAFDTPVYSAPISNVTLLNPNPKQYPSESADFAGRRFHFMGAGGIGVSAMMELCASRGAIVSGCDCSNSRQVEALRAKGFKVDIGHCASHVGECDELVHTAAVSSSHPEVQQAEREGKNVNARMHMLGRIAKGLRSVCVTGAHGKTTTTWMIAHMLIAAGLDPSVLLGGVVKAMNGNVRVGSGGLFVAEIDESDNRLHEVVPHIPVLTNIDNDHLDHYGTVDAIEAAALDFMSSLDKEDPRSVLVGCGDDVRVRRILAKAHVISRRQYIAYGLGANCTVRALNLRTECDGLSWKFDVLGPFGLWVDMQLPMPGEHNVLNALACISVGWQLGVSENDIRQSLANMERVGRRFEIKANKRGIRVVDDYGHHPTEIEATLRAARASTEKRLGVLFQPHRYTRTAALMDQFAACFSDADAVFLLPIYAAGETAIAGVDQNALAVAIRKQIDIPVKTAGDKAEAIAMLLEWAQPGDTLVTQGAGDVTRISDELVSRL